VGSGEGEGTAQRRTSRLIQLKAGSKSFSLILWEAEWRVMPGERKAWNV
jgi:hypothetical protein